MYRLINRQSNRLDAYVCLNVKIINGYEITNNSE